MTAPAKQPDRCCRRLAWRDLELAPIRALIQLAKDEDLVGSGLRGGAPHHGDHSSALLDESLRLEARLQARKPMVLCGIELAREVLAAFDPGLALEPNAADGACLQSGDTIATVAGPARSLLTAERPLLNFLQKLSGVSTLTRQYVDALGQSSTRLLDTRKTTPGFRMLEKYAFACGGGFNHRIGLFDRVMLKDNHLAAFAENPRSAARAAVAASRQRNPSLLVEMEVDRLEQVEHALYAEVDIILLDNFSPPDLAAAVAQIGDRAVTEASGGVTLESLPELAAIGLDFISTGAPVHQSVWIDIGLDA